MFRSRISTDRYGRPQRAFAPPGGSAAARTPAAISPPPVPVAGARIRQEDGSLKSLTPRQVADLLGHSTSEITELYYVKKDTARLNGITNGFEL